MKLVQALWPIFILLIPAFALAQDTEQNPPPIAAVESPELTVVEVEPVRESKPANRQRNILGRLLDRREPEPNAVSAPETPPIEIEELAEVEVISVETELEVVAEAAPVESAQPAAAPAELTPVAEVDPGPEPAAAEPGVDVEMETIEEPLRSRVLTALFTRRSGSESARAEEAVAVETGETESVEAAAKPQESEIVELVEASEPDLETEDDKTRVLTTLFTRRSEETAETELTLEPEPEAEEPQNEKSESLLSRILPRSKMGAEPEEPTLVDLYPKNENMRVPDDKKVRDQVKLLMDDISANFVERVESFDDPELHISENEEVVGDPETIWAGEVASSLWPQQTAVSRSLADAYAISLQHSKQVKSLSRVPLIYEATAMEGLIPFGAEFFAQGDYDHTDEPTGSTLTTGQTGRFRQDEISSDAGIRKTFWNGAQLQLSNRLSTLDNNSEFLDPNPQTGSEVAASFVMPVLRGAGRQNTLATFRVAKLESDVAAVAFLQQLQDHVVQVNQAYWTLYLARAAYRQRVELTDKTRKIVEKLEKRQELDADATKSELFRAKAAVKKREADVQRARMSVRVAEERLRSLVNDPDIRMGASGEWIPTSEPVLSPPKHDIRLVSLAALANRSELIQGVLSVEAAAIQRNRAANDLKPQLDLVAEIGYSGVDGGRDVSGAYGDLVDHGTDFRAGFRFSQLLNRDLARSSVRRRDLEYFQRVDELDLIADRVLLDILVRYREMLSAYRDMHAKYQSLQASREELNDLQKRSDLDADEQARTVAYYLQLTLDALERNQIAEEEFLVAVVSYNTALTVMDQAQGTLLQYENVGILREEGERGGVDELKIRKN